MECKCYTWTIGSNSPSAKLSTLNEAVLYMSHLPSNTIKIIAMKQTYSPSRAESLAQYFCRLYGHFLRDIEVWEFADDGTYMVVYNRSLLKRRVQALNIQPKIDSITNMKELWWHGTEQQWKDAVEHYWALVKPDHIPIEKRLEQMSMDVIASYSAEEFYRFLHNEYFFWKFTAKNRFATTRAQLIRYHTEHRMNELEDIRRKLISFDYNDTYCGFKIATSIHGLGTAGASGLLSILLPRYFGTVDQFVVGALCSIQDLPERDYVLKMKPESLTIKDGLKLNQIMKEKSQQLNSRFNSEKWTPRILDKILWSKDRER